MRQCRKLFHIQRKVENQIQVKRVNSGNLFMQETGNSHCHHTVNSLINDGGIPEYFLFSSL